MKRLILSTIAVGILIGFSGCSSKKYFVKWSASPQDKNTKLYCDYGHGYKLSSFRYPTAYKITNEVKESKILHLNKCKVVFGDSYTEFLPTTVDLNKFPNSLSGTITASKYTVKYDSLPRGATVVCENNIVGKTPIELAYYTDSEDKANKLSIKECKSIWSNGASAKYPISISLSTESTSFLVQLPISKDYEKIQTRYENDLQDKDSANTQRKMQQNRLNEQRRHNSRIEAQEDSRRTQQALDGLNKQLRDMTPKTYNVNVRQY